MKNRFTIILIFLIIILIIIKFDVFNKKQIETSKINTIEINNKPDDEKEIPKIENAEPKKEEKEVAIFKCPTPKKEYDDMSLLNIGQSIGLKDKTYIPKDLQELSLSEGTRKELCLVGNVKEELSLMIKDAEKNNVNIRVSSAFRSYSTQKIIYENDLREKGLNDSDGVAKPGYSEHQLGTTIDITGASINYSSASSKFDGTTEDTWLKNNAYLYGFIQSYPSGKEKVTGYKYEPWHYRYVGRNIAKKIKNLDITITEFLETE